MKCSQCNETLNDEIVGFSEESEKYYCIKCCRDHKHEFTFFEYRDGNLNPIPIGFTAAGINDFHKQFFYEREWIENRMGCPHALEKLDKGQPIFECSDKKFRCSECFYDSDFEDIIPLMKSDDGQILSIIPRKIPPFNLDVKFNCDDYGIKGQNINSTLSIINNKKNAITDIYVVVEAFAAKPLPENVSYPQYHDKIYPCCVFRKEMRNDLIKSEDKLTFEFNIAIPRDGEIKKGQFLKYPYEMELSEEYGETRLDIPKELMIYAQFTYKTCSGHTFYSYVETDVVKIE